VAVFPCYGLPAGEGIYGAGGHCRGHGLAQRAAARLCRGVPGSENSLNHGQKLACHARLETTAIYLEVSGDEERELAKRLWAAD